MNFIFISIIIFILSLPSSTFASDHSDPELVFPLTKNAPSRYSGVGLTTPAAAKIMAQYEANKALLEAAVDKAKDIEMANCEYKTNNLKTSFQTTITIKDKIISNKDTQIFELTQIVKKLDTSSGMDPISLSLLSGGIGVLLGIVITTVVVFVVQ